MRIYEMQRVTSTNKVLIERGKLESRLESIQAISENTVIAKEVVEELKRKEIKNFADYVRTTIADQKGEDLQFKIAHIYSDNKNEIIIFPIKEDDKNIFPVFFDTEMNMYFIDTEVTEDGE